MSDGYVTVGQCVEGLPLGRFVWEVLFCGFLAWFLLGAINECTPMAFSLVVTNWKTTPQSVFDMSAALALGNFVAIAIAGWLADTQGRLAVIRPALLLTVVAGFLVQWASNFAQALVARFFLGLVSGGLLTVMPPLIAELLPSKHRAYYLTIWCCGWPAGALFSLGLGTAMPGLDWREYYTMLLVPVVFLYIGIRLDMLVESPRFLYMVGECEEGYNILVDMWEKEELPLPWSAESISVTCASLGPEVERRSSSCSTSGKSKSPAYNSITLWLSLAMFAASAAAQSMKLWMPTMLIAHNADAVTQSPDFMDMSARGGPLSFASGPRALGLLSVVQAPLMFSEPDYGAVHVLMEAYVLELLGIILCAYLASYVSRKRMVQFPLFTAGVLTVANLIAAADRHLWLCGPLVGAQLAMQSTGINFLQVFASEFFPTKRRARTVACANFAAQLGSLTVPILGGLVVRDASAATAVALFAGLYFSAWLISYALPLQTGLIARPLHDVDDVPSSVSREVSGKKRAWTSYNSI